MKAEGSINAALIGWQTMLADLSLILFMVTAAAIAGARRAPVPAKSPCNSAQGEPLALWRAGGAQTLGRWLAAQQFDDRQQLTITAHYRRGGEGRALAAVQALVSQAGTMGESARVIVAPAGDAAGDETLASLAYDRAPGSGTAQGLHDPSRILRTRTPP